MKKFISKKMKIFISLLAVISIGCYIAAAIVLYNSDFKLSNYINQWTYNWDWDFDFHDDWNINWGNYRDLGTLERDFSDEIKDININTTSIDIKIQFYDGEKLKMDATTNTWNNTTIEDMINNLTTLNNALSMDLSPNGCNDVNFNIYIPIKYKNNLNITSASGDKEIISGEFNNLTLSSNSGEIKLSNVNTKEFNAQTSSGDIDISNVTATTTKLNTTSGDIDIINSFLGELSASTSSGEMNLSFRDLGNNSSISSNSGDIDLNINDTVGYKLNFNTVSGDISGNFGSIDINNKKNYSFTNGDGGKIIDVRTSSGELKVY